MPPKVPGRAGSGAPPGTAGAARESRSAGGAGGAHSALPPAAAALQAPAGPAAEHCTGLLHGCSADMTSRCLPPLAGCPPGHSADVSGTDLPLSSPPGGGAEVTAPALPVTGTAPVSPTSPLAAAGRSCARRTAPRPSLQ